MSVGAMSTTDDVKYDDMPVIRDYFLISSFIVGGALCVCSTPYILICILDAIPAKNSIYNADCTS